MPCSVIDLQIISNMWSETGAAASRTGIDEYGRIMLLTTLQFWTFVYLHLHPSLDQDASV